MAKSSYGPEAGTVILVSLCFVAVLGIMLAGYLAVCSRVMNLSNRGFQTELSKQLAEAGVEEALRAFNKNDWSDWTGAGIDVNWTVDTTNKRATATISYPSGKFGQGITATVKVRVDNYDAHILGSSWSSSKNYRIGDLVGYNGLWYRCVRDHINQAPNGGISNFWAPEGVSWRWDANVTYAVEQVISYNGYWYQCTTLNSNSPPTGSTSSNANWTYIPAVTKDSTTGVFGVQDAVVDWYGVWWRWNAGTWNSAPPIAWRWRSSGRQFSFNDTVYHASVWYRYISATPTNTTSTYSAPASDTSRWSPLTSMFTWSSAGMNYSIGDVVYHTTTAQWYRCIMAHTSSASLTPTSTTYWSNTPALSQQWAAGSYYASGDTVRFNGTWYLCILSHTSSTSIIPTNTSYWISALTTDTSYIWNSATAYAVNAYRCYGGVWYRCTVANTGRTPNDTGYWAPTWTQSSGASTGATVVYSQATITLGDGTTSRTQLRSPIAPAPLFPNAAAASGTITASSGGTVDSYDSTVGAVSSSQYSSQLGNTSTNYSAVIASSYSAGTAITLSSTNVQGYLAAPPSSSSPFAPLVSSGGTVKGPTPSVPNLDPTRLTRSSYIPQFDPLPRGGLATNWATTPKGTALALASTVNIGIPGATTPSRFFHNGNLTIGGASIQYLNIEGPVILYVNGNLNITNSSSIGRITIDSTGSAEIHVAGRFMADAGGEGILSRTYDPKSLIIICDTTSSSSHFYSEGVNPLYGVIYIPNSTSTTGYYNDNNSTNIYGAVSANKITYSGANMNIHYDTSLRYATFGGVDQPYTVTQWRELDAAEWATMP